MKTIIYNHIAYFILITLIVSCSNDNDDISQPKTLPGTEGSTIDIIKELTIDIIEEGNFITNFEYDKTGILWIGTFNGGLIKVDNDQFTNYTTNNSALPGNLINDIFIDQNSKVWVATNFGFAAFENEVWSFYTSANTPLVVDNVSAIRVNKKNEVLVGNGNVSEGGLLLFSEGNWKNFTTDNSILPCSAIHEIEVADDGSFWVGTYQLLGKGGLVKVSNGEITQLYDKDNNGLLYNTLSDIEINNDCIWLGYWAAIFNESGFSDGGIQLLNEQKNSIETFFPNDSKIVSNRITAMKVHSNGSLWFCTSIDDPGCDNCWAGVGTILDDGSFLAVSTLNADISPNQFFPYINEDHLGNMIYATEKTLYKAVIK